MQQGISALFALVLSFSVYAEVYRWVDENGVTHFSTTPPVAQEVEELDLSHGLTREIPKEAEELRDAFIAEALKDNGDADELNCDAAVENAHYMLDHMLETGQKNVDGGYVDSKEFTQVKLGLRRIKSSVSVRECKSAKGDKRGFYLCLSNSHNHIIQCGKKYNYEA